MFHALMLLITLASAAPAEETNSYVNLYPRWDVGARQQYVMTCIDKWMHNGEVQEHTKRTIEIETEVLEAGASGYLMSWSVCEHSKNLNRKEDSQAAMFADIIADTITTQYRLLLEMDQQATITELRNWKEMMTNNSDPSPSPLDRLGATNLDEDYLIELQKQWSRIETRKAVVETFLTIEPGYLFDIFVRNYILGETSTEDIPLFLPLMLIEIPGRATITMTEFDSEARCAKIKMKQSIDPKDARRILDAISNKRPHKKDTQEQEIQPNEPITPNRFAFDFEGSYLVDVEACQVINATIEKRTTFEKSSRTESITIERKKG